MNAIFHYEKILYDYKTETLYAPIRTANYEIYQVGDAYWDRLSIEEHHQIFDIELSVVRNETEMSTDGRVEAIARNSAYLSLRDDMHGIEAKNFCRYQYIAFNIMPESKHYAKLTAIRERFKLGSRVINSAQLLSVLTRVLAEIMNDLPYSEDMLDSLLTQMIVLLFRGDSAAERQYGSSDELVTQICSFIDTNFLDIKYLTVVADRFGYSYPYLSRLFESKMKTTLQNYWVTRKMEFARELLESGKSVTETAEIIDYGSIYNFSRAYKNYFGISPRNRNDTAEG